MPSRIWEYTITFGCWFYGGYIKLLLYFTFSLLARVSTVAADAISAATADVVDLSSRDCSRFRDNCWFGHSQWQQQWRLIRQVDRYFAFRKISTPCDGHGGSGLSAGCGLGWWTFCSTVAVAVALDNLEDLAGGSLFRISQNINTLRWTRWQWSICGMWSRVMGVLFDCGGGSGSCIG